jgi:putative permease
MSRTPRSIAALATQLLVLLFLYELLRHGRDWVEKALLVLPEGETVERLIRNIHGTIVGVLAGTLVAAVSEGALTAVVFAVADIQFAVLLGLLCGLTSIGPVVGCSLVWAPRRNLPNRQRLHRTGGGRGSLLCHRDRCYR